jgi:hypothetical protein
VGYGIRAKQISKPRVRPVSRGQRSQSLPLEPIHFRAPLNWLGLVKSKRVREWFHEFLDGRISLSSSDPGPGPLELSVRLPRGTLRHTARALKVESAVLLRRLIAARMGLTDRARQKPGSLALLPRLSTGPAETAAGSSTKPSPSQAEPLFNVSRPLKIVTYVDGHRTLDEIGQAIRLGCGVTAEEFIRWRAVYERK